MITPYAFSTLSLFKHYISLLLLSIASSPLPIVDNDDDDYDGDINLE
jgi:hypothetical protein